jgi:hypothetical protein
MNSQPRVRGALRVVSHDDDRVFHQLSNDILHRSCGETDCRSSTPFYRSAVSPSSLKAAVFDRFSHTTNARPAARRIRPPRKMSAIGAPVFARMPVDAAGCVPPGESDDVLVLPALSLELVADVVAALSDVGDVVGDVVGDAVGDADGDVFGDADGDGGFAAPVL